MTKKPTTRTPAQAEATKAEFMREFRALLAKDPDRAVSVWLNLAEGVVATLQRRVAVRAVEGRSLSARDQAGLAELRAGIAQVLEAASPDRVAEQRRAQLEAALRPS